MTISRGQMNRQLYMGGGIMNAIPREQFGLGSKLKKLGKKAVKGVKKIASSDLGKAALLAAGAYYAGGGNLFGLQRAGMSGFSPLNIPGVKGGLDFLGGVRGGSDLMFNYAPNQLSSAFKLGQKITGGGITGALGKGAALAGVSAFLTSKYGMTEEQAEEELTRDPAKYLRMYYTNLNPNAGSEEIEEFVRQNSADGGRIGYALGDSASDNAMQAAGIEGLPIRQNPKGVKELDLRETGGFIPPVGIKEKEDDIPAMLSNNEFVFTADAVRGMGDGDVDVGAQRMYNMMKQLEAGGRV